MIDFAGLPALSQAEAERAIESLRKGVPPTGLVRHFTVGRTAELDQLAASFANPRASGGSAWLLRADWGAGKSHLLKVIRELALRAGYAVASVTIDTNGGVRFNRMDTVFGAICRSIEVSSSTAAGIGSVLDCFARIEEASVDDENAVNIRRDIIGDDWGFSERLGSAALFVALRAWVHGAPGSDTREEVVNWLSFPADYRTQRKALYEKLVAFPGRRFRDPRQETKFYADGVFSLHPQGYDQCWRALGDIDLIAKASGLKGLVLLFDEFEDVVTNLNNSSYQQEAFHNLFRFFAGQRFPGTAYFAVTPGFAEKCKAELLRRGIYDFPLKRFDDLPQIQMSPIGVEDFRCLAVRIVELHGVAYAWNAKAAIGDMELSSLVAALFHSSSRDQIRKAIKGLVEALDSSLASWDA